MNIKIYTDGSAKGNPGPGGYGIVLLSNDGHRKEAAKGFRKTTNNRMELRAVIKGLQMLKKSPLDVVVYTDSKYVSEAVNKKWVLGWEKKGFKNKKNADLWIKFLEVFRKHNVRIKWIKGHNQHPQNEYCDKIAVKASKQIESHIEDTGYQNKK